LPPDVVVTGHDRSEIGVLVFPTRGRPSQLPDRAAPCEAACSEGLRSLLADGGGSSQLANRARWCWLDEPPSMDAGEITDKGYINQRLVLAAPRRRRRSPVRHAGRPARDPTLMKATR
jgi:feruloyl-CoA synthase